MKVVIRTDASLQIGTGHVMRCLTLAQAIREKGGEVEFICREHEGHLGPVIAEKDFPVHLLENSGTHEPKDNLFHSEWLGVSQEKDAEQSSRILAKVKPDWLIIDHYAIAQKWQKLLRPYSRFIFQIDDLADRSHDVDLILDQNFYIESERRYHDLVPRFSSILIGPKYALLRPDFYQARLKLTGYEQRMKQKEVVLFFGGVDISNETEKALSGVLSVNSSDHFHVIIGINNPHKLKLENICRQHDGRVTLHVQVTNISCFLSRAYLYIGAVGATTWERCILGLPGLVCSVADNQTQLANDLQHINAHYYLGKNNQLSEKDYQVAYKQLLLDPETLKQQSSICLSLVDGLGAERVFDKLKDVEKNG